MAPLPTLTVSGSSEEWNDAEFDFLDGEPMHTSDTETDKEEEAEEDWDMEMNLGKTGGAKAQLVLQGIAARSGPSKNVSQAFAIRPPLSPSSPEEDEDEPQPEWGRDEPEDKPEPESPVNRPPTPEPARTLAV